MATAAEAPVPVFVMQAGSDSMIMPCQVCALGDMLGVQTITAPQVAHDLMLVRLMLGTGGKSWSAGRACLLTYHLSQTCNLCACRTLGGRWQRRHWSPGSRAWCHQGATVCLLQPDLQTAAVSSGDTDIYLALKVEA